MLLHHLCHKLVQTFILFKETSKVKTFSLLLVVRRQVQKLKLLVWKSLFVVAADSCIWVSMQVLENKLSVRRCLTFVTGLVECLCFAGVVFGWASLVFVLKEDGYFSSLCFNTTGVNGTQILGQLDVSTAAGLFVTIYSILSFNCKCYCIVFKIVA